MDYIFIPPVIYRKNKYSNVLNGYVRETSTGSSCRMSREPNNGTFYGRPSKVSQNFLNSTQKHIKLIVERFGTIKMQMLKVYNNLFLVSTGRKLLKIYQLMRKLIFLTQHRDPPWLTKLIKSKLKERSKITKEFYRKGQDPTVFTSYACIW